MFHLDPATPRHERAKIAAKAVLAYGGACLMLIDAGCAMAAHCLPCMSHAAALVGDYGKLGAAMGGCAVFFDRLMEW